MPRANCSRQHQYLVSNYENYGAERYGDRITCVDHDVCRSNSLQLTSPAFKVKFHTFTFWIVICLFTFQFIWKYEYIYTFHSWWTEWIQSMHCAYNSWCWLFKWGPMHQKSGKNGIALQESSEGLGRSGSLWKWLTVNKMYIYIIYSFLKLWRLNYPTSV